jgi:hypothetical protein
MMGILTRQNMVERFLEEARKLLDLEYGRASLPTAQALYLMYLTHAWLGRDRAGTIFRYMCFEMLARLNLEKRFHELNDENSHDVREKLVISKIVWGIFLVEWYEAYVSLYVDQLLIFGVVESVTSTVSRVWLVIHLFPCRLMKDTCSYPDMSKTLTFLVSHSMNPRPSRLKRLEYCVLSRNWYNWNMILYNIPTALLKKGASVMSRLDKPCMRGGSR